AGGSRAAITAMGSTTNLTDDQILSVDNFTGARINNSLGTLYNTNIQKIGTVDSHLTVHDNAPASVSGHCNALQNTTAGLTGLARLNAKGTATAVTFARYPTGAGIGVNGNAFGIQCSNCHNSGDGSFPGYGGIHGNAFRVTDGRYGAAPTTTVQHDATFTAYSTNAARTIGVASDVTVVTGHKPYRFLPGLGNFRFNHGTDLTMQARSLSSQNNMGCYTLAASNNTKSRTYPVSAKLGAGRWATASGQSTANDNGLFGSWGACQ